MVSKLFNYLIWAILIAIILGILWLLVEPLIWWTPYSEVRLCIRIFLIMFALNTFAVLRLYNSIVQNTRFSIKLRETLAKLSGSFPGFERAMKGLGNTLSAHKATLDSLKKETSENTDAVKKLTEGLSKKYKQ